jgi:hypothetical protein
MIGALKGAKNMTRETKVGLVVCCSFLCLVGVVLGCKLRGEGDQADADGQSVVDEPVTDSVSPPIAIKAPPAVDSEHPSAPLPAPPAPAQIAPVKPEDVKLVTAPSTLQQTNGGENKPGAPVVEPVEVKQTQPVANVSQPEQSSSGEQPESVVRVMPTLIAGLVWSEPATRDLVGFGSLQIQAGGPVESDLDGIRDVVNDKNGANPGGLGASSFTGGAVQPTVHAGDAELITPPPPPPTATKPGIPPVLPSTEASSVQTAPATSTQDAHAPAPGASLLAPVVPSTPGAGGNERRDHAPAGVMPSPPPSVQVPSADDSPERHPGAPVSGSLPPIGTPPTAVTPPIAVPSPGVPSAPPAPSPATTTPKVEVFDEETYLCQPGDTFDKISLAHYHTENYGKALLQFNIDHPLANDKVRRNPPVLEPGQAVYIPPTRILESRYGAFYIPGYKPAPQQGAAPAGAAPASGDHSTNASPGATGNFSPIYKQYRVQSQGETMREIARATLGNADRWSEIYNLNRDYKPEFRVPGGTVLRMPGDANLTR